MSGDTGTVTRLCVPYNSRGLGLDRESLGYLMFCLQMSAHLPLLSFSKQTVGDIG